MNHRQTTTTTLSSSKPQHILLLGASGATGLAFIQHHLSLPDSSPTKPYLTLYIRSSARSKLLPLLPNASSSSSSNSTVAPRTRIIEGSLTDSSALRRALSATDSISTSTSTSNSTSSSSFGPGSDSAASLKFPPVTTVISVLGAYMSLYYFLTRSTPTPITDAFNSTVLPALRDANVTRILVLSTPTAHPVQGERERMSWSWWLQCLLPVVVVPQGAAEMKGLADAVTAGQNENARGLQATVFRVPMLTNGETGTGVEAGFLGDEGFVGKKTLARGEMVKWLVQEVQEGKWIGKAPMLCDR